MPTPAASAEVKLQFLTLLAERFGADPKRIDEAIAQYRADPGPELARKLHEAAEPRLQELLRRLNLAPGGTAVLVRMREDVLRHIPGPSRSSGASTPISSTCSLPGSTAASWS